MTDAEFAAAVDSSRDAAFDASFRVVSATYGTGRPVPSAAVNDLVTEARLCTIEALLMQAACAGAPDDKGAWAAWFKGYWASVADIINKAG